MNKKSGNVEVAKFICALIIMTYHLKMFGIEEHPFAVDVWVYVEFFLLLTGYFTAKHFDGKTYDNPAKESFIYTIKKFIGFLPYIVVSTLIMTFFVMFGRLSAGMISTSGFWVGFVESVIFDSMLISESFTTPMNGPLWYLSTMFILFPFFARFEMIKNRYVRMMVSGGYAIFYYGYVGILDDVQHPDIFFRVLAGMCLGSFLYEFFYIIRDYMENMNKVLLTVIELVTFIVPIVLMGFNISATRLDMFFVMISSGIMLSQLSLTSAIGGKIASFLGRISITMYIMQASVWTVLGFFYFKNKLPMATTVVLYYLVTIVVSAGLMLVVERWKWFQNLSKKPLILRD